MKLWTPKKGVTPPPADVTIYEGQGDPGDEAPPSGEVGKTFYHDTTTGILYRLDSR